MSRAKWAMSLILAAVLLQPAFGASAEGSVNAAAKNVQITLTITKSKGGEPPRVVRLVGQEGVRARMLLGWRIPIPMSSAAPDQAGKSVTNFIYQNVGVSAEITPLLLGQGRLQLDGQLELSGLREAQGATGEKAPLIGTFQQALKVIVQEGKKVRIAEGPDPEGGTVSLDIEAVVLP